jgi:ubiquinone/menaquinone biosynthesis C-methylase UbiE
MFIENRPADGEVASTPEAWATAFRHSVPFAFGTNVSMQLDSRWPLIKRYIPKGARILDAGCGLGEWVQFLSRRGYSAEGLDYSPELIARLRAAYPASAWTEARTQSMPYGNDTFDAIVSWGVIEHDPNGPHQALSEFRRVLNRNGHIIVTVPVDTARMRADSRSQFPNGGKFFQFLFSPEELSSAVAASGFRVIDAGLCSKNALTLLFPQARTIPAPLRAIVKALPAIRGYHAMIYAVCQRA